MSTGDFQLVVVTEAVARVISSGRLSVGPQGLKNFFDERGIVIDLEREKGSSSRRLTFSKEGVVLRIRYVEMVHFESGRILHEFYDSKKVGESSSIEIDRLEFWEFLPWTTMVRFYFNETYL